MMRFPVWPRLLAALSLAGALGVGASPLEAQTGKKKPTAPSDGTRGTDQVKGGDGIFGQTYSLQSGFNLRIVSAEFSIERFVAYETVYPKPDEKLLLLHISLKNANKEDNFFNSENHTFTVVTSDDQDHTGTTWRRDSTREKGSSITLKPGQGVEDLVACIPVPAKTPLKKMILNQGRFGTQDKVIRFPLDNPKNKIAPLPEYARDPADKSGTSTLTELPGKKNVYYPLRRFDLRLDSVAFSSDTYNGASAEEGKRYVVATVTVKVRVPGDSTLFELKEGGATITDGDGERTAALKDYGYRKAKADEDANPMLKENDETTCRIFFQVSKNAVLKTLTLAEAGSRAFVFDVADVK